MKKLLVIAVAAALASPVALADNTPDNVGNVTYLGNIVASSPMWQWTVNDYPGGRLDAKPSGSTTVDGVTTYPLSGRPFIAVDGYLPSLSYVTGTTVPGRSVGYADKTSFTDLQGNGPGEFTDEGGGAVTFTVHASGTNNTGSPVTGKLKLRSTELRGQRVGYTNITTGESRKMLRVTGWTQHHLATKDGSCFSGIGSYASPADVVSGTADNPIGGTQSPSAWAAFISALHTADVQGNATAWSTLKGGEGDATFMNRSCETPTPLSLNYTGEGVYTAGYVSAAHVVELTPVALEFNTPLQGTWNSTLTVTAYQM